MTVTGDSRQGPVYPDGLAAGRRLAFYAEHFDNDPDGDAFHNARTLRQLLRERGHRPLPAPWRRFARPGRFSLAPPGYASGMTIFNDQHRGVPPRQQLLDRSRSGHHHVR